MNKMKSLEELKKQETIANTDKLKAEKRKLEAEAKKLTAEKDSILYRDGIEAIKTFLYVFLVTAGLVTAVAHLYKALAPAVGG